MTTHTYAHVLLLSSHRTQSMLMLTTAALPMNPNLSHNVIHTWTSKNLLNKYKFNIEQHSKQLIW